MATATESTWFVLTDAEMAKLHFLFAVGIGIGLYGSRITAAFLAVTVLWSYFVLLAMVHNLSNTGSD